MPFAGTLGDLSANTGGSPGGTESFVYTLMLNGSATSITCTIVSPATQQCADHSHSVTTVAGDRVDVRLVISAGANARPHVVALSIRP